MLEEALDILAEHGDAAKVMAGGQSLLILLRERFVDPEVLVGLNGIEPLRHVDVNGGARIGAMVTHATIERDARIIGGWPLLTAAPPAALIACDARVHLASKQGGAREVAAEDFFIGIMETVARPDEMVTAVSLPPQPDGARGAYLKYAIRPLDFAIVGVSARVVLGPDGTIADARIGLNGAANRAVRATEAEALLLGERPSPELFGRAGDAAAQQSAPLGDVDGSADYKRRVIGVYTRRVLARALE